MKWCATAVPGTREGLNTDLPAPFSAMLTAPTGSDNAAREPNERSTMQSLQSVLCALQPGPTCTAQFGT